MDTVNSIKNLSPSGEKDGSQSPFDYYIPFFSQKSNKWVPGIKACPLSLEKFSEFLDNQEIDTLCKEVENGQKDKKLALPAVCWTGKAQTGQRKAEDMTPTQYYMVDIDHVKASPQPSPVGREQNSVKEAWMQIVDGMTRDMKSPDDYGITLVHITPSGKGLRIVARCVKEFPTLTEHMTWLNEELHLSKYGDFDEVVKDLSRISFLIPRRNILLFKEEMFCPSPALPRREGEDYPQGPIKQISNETQKIKKNSTQDDSEGPQTSEENNPQTLSDPLSTGEGRGEALQDFTFNGFPVSEIAQQYVKHFFDGKVEEGRKHAAYNQMVKDFRHICDNNPHVLYALLPRFEPTDSDRFSQCQSICKTNNYGTDLPPKFEVFLREYGYIPTLSKVQQAVSPVVKASEEPDIDDEEDDTYKPAPLPKKLPPVFREILATAPKEFIVPCVNALLPVMGTLTSYLRAIYPSDLREHSTEFFSVIYAPPSTGKGFVERFMSLLLSDLKDRDKLTSLRDQIYNMVCTKKGDSKEKPELMKTQCRIMPARNSLGEALKKMVANKGHHVFTYAAEIDEWAKGVKAAGGDKDDLMRIAWDNGEYGQMFQATNTFKGTVNVFWNVLMCGTPGQMMKYFKNTENGLVSRASFSEIIKIRYTTAPQWKALNKNALNAFKKFRERCDRMTYKEPLNYNIEDAFQYGTDLEAFDKEVPYNYEFQPFTFIDLNWLFRELVKWQKVQNKINAANQDEAADEFIPRVMVRGFRLGLLCNALWDKVGDKEKEVIKDFVIWWMNEDLHNMCALWADKRESTDVSNKSPKQKLYDLLPGTFTKIEVAKAAEQCKVESPVKAIVSTYVTNGIAEKISKNTWHKLLKISK